MSQLQTDTFRKRIRTEQLQLLAQQTLAAVIGNVVAAIVLVLVFWDITHRGLLVGVMIALPICVFIRLWIAKKFLQDSSAKSISTWSKLFLISIGLFGAFWGIVGLFFFTTQDPWNLMFVAMVILSLTAAGIGSLSVYIPTYFAFATPMMAALIFQFFMHKTDISIALGVGGITFLIACVIWSRNLNKTILESITLRFENIDLVGQLRFQKDQATLAKNDAEKANVTKSRFLAAASHDLRQPLHAQGLFLSALDEHLSNPESRQLVDRIKNSSLMLRDLLDSLLDISKLDAGVLKANRKALSLQSVFNSMLEEFLPQAEEKGLCLRLIDTSVWVFSDRDMLTRILRNLLTNALHYTERGRVVFGARRSQGKIRIEVWDSGIGIHTDYLETIFDEFHQLNNPGRDRRKGLGLGLAIVRRLARLLNHSINVKSRLGHGSVFQVLVLQEVALAHAEQRLIANPGDNLQGARILLVDDEKEIRQGFTVLLQQWGCIVTTANDNVEALEIVKQENMPDLIVADYRLQNDVTGLETVKQINQCLSVSIPAIIVTGDTAAERLQEAKAGGYPLLSKPVPPSKLRTLMNTELLKARTKTNSQ